MRNDQGVLHTVPIPKAMAYLMLRPLLDDVADDEMCGVQPNRTFPVNERYHAILLEAVQRSRMSLPVTRSGGTAT